MSRLILVSNRLPVTVAEKSGRLLLQESSGGLVTAIGGYLEHRRKEKDFECIWAGWPGGEVGEPHRESLEASLRGEHGVHPVWLPDGDMDPFYNGFCNRTLWPLFHYLPSLTQYDEAYWEAYVRVNGKFGNSILKLLEPGDSVWIQDYQLLLLPRLLKEARPDIAVGFFLHIPFPSFELFRLLPAKWRRALLGGMLGADLVGFHTYDYTQYFLRSVHRTLGYEHHLGTVFMGDRVARADTFPLGIDYEKFQQAVSAPAVLQEKVALSAKLRGMKIISSVDRLDYTKGILQRLKGFEYFLACNREWLGRVVFILTVVPSREEVDQYQKMKMDIDGLVGHINGGFGDTSWTPVLYQYRSLTFNSLVALYNVSDVALITPLRDGMNLVAKEYLACQQGESGVLILSEMAGAARELGEALMVNPNHKVEVAEAIHQALIMPREERIRRNQAMQERLRKHDSNHWADSFQDSLEEIRDLQARLDARHLGPIQREAMRTRFRGAASRLILLDYDGTLIPFAPHPRMAVPDPSLLGLLERLVQDERNHVFLISGRSRDVLKEWFGGLGLGLIAEHGVWINEKEGDWMLVKPLETAWKAKVRPILDAFVDRLPGSFLEEKDFSIAWHYRNSDPELAAQRARELTDTLVHFTANLDIQVLEGKKVIEARCAGVNKGTAAAALRAELNPEFTLAVGDDSTDEDLFRAFPRHADTIRVGMKSSFAQFNLRDFTEVRWLLEDLAAEDKAGIGTEKIASE